MNSDWILASLHTITDGIVVVDAQNLVRFCNRAAVLLGIQTDQPITAMLPPDILTPLPITRQVAFSPPSGSSIQLEITSTPTLWEGIKGWILTLRDVTAHKQLEAAEQEQRILADTLREAASQLSILTDLNAVMDGILDLVARALPYDSASIMMIDGSRAVLLRERGLSERGIQTAGWTLEIVPDGKLDRMLRTGEAFLAPDVRLMPDWEQLEGTEWIRGHVSTVIRVGGNGIGILNLDSETVGLYTEVHAQRLQAFADQIGIALRNAKLLNEYARYAEKLTAIVEERTAEERRKHEQVEAGLRAALEAEHAALEAEHAALEAEHAAYLSQKNLNDMITRFVSVISHEFRTPLATILLSSDMIKSYGSRMTLERLLASADSIQLEVKKINNMIEEILFTHRAERVGMDFHPDLIDINQLAQNVVEDVLRISAPTHRIEIVAGAGCIQAPLDERLIRRALMNLLLNAIKYSPDGSTITFAFDCDAETVSFRVHDQGMGIPLEDMPHIFEMFWRGKEARGYPGSGLGLTIVKQVIDLHGGKIAVISESEGGTTFTITLPRNVERDLVKSPVNEAAVKL